MTERHLLGDSGAQMSAAGDGASQAIQLFTITAKTLALRDYLSRIDRAAALANFAWYKDVPTLPTNKEAARQVVAREVFIIRSSDWNKLKEMTALTDAERCGK